MGQEWHKNVAQEDVDKATAAFKKAFSFPQVVSARWDQPSATILSKWTQVSTADLSGKRTFNRVSFVQDPETVVTSSPIPVTGSELASLPKNGAIAKIINKSSTYILEIWRSSKLDKAFCLNDYGLHGQVYFDNQFGSLALDDQGQRVAFVAEQKRPTSQPFFKPGNGSLQGQEYNMHDDWGEQMSNKSRSVLVVVDLIKDDIKVIDKELPDKYCHGNVLWKGPDTLIGTATDYGPYRLGIIYTTSKASKVFQINVGNPGESYQIISKDTADIACRSPRLSPDGKTLIWLERDVNSGKAKPGPHACCLRLMAKSLEKDPVKADPRIVIETLFNFQPGIDNFAGLYINTLPVRCFTDDNRVVLTTIVNDKHVPVVAKLDGLDDFQVLTDKINLQVTDIVGKDVIAVHSTPLETPSIVKFNLDDQSGKNTVIVGPDTSLDVSNLVTRTLIHEPSEQHELQEFRNVKFSSLFIGRTDLDNCPLIVWPHGGPHSVVPATFNNDVHFFLNMGYSVLFPNYRGSLGNGQNGVLSLTSYPGRYDVKDCHQAVMEVLNEFPKLDKSQVFLYGGSHGGFLVTHLAGQYPNTFRAVVARNPVINVATKVMPADNPDSGFNSAGFDFDGTSPDPDQMARMYDNSPISHVGNVKIPVHLNLGTEDRRVPKSQGLEYYRNLKALGKDVSVNIYEDNHPLAKVSSHSNIIMNAVLFFKSILN